MNVPFAGGCVYGAVRYECSVGPIMIFRCRCRDCQGVTGGGFVASFLVPAAAFRLTKGSYATISRRAWRRPTQTQLLRCGSRLTGAESDERPTGIVGITTGSPNDPSWFRPQLEFSCRMHNRGFTWTRPFRSMISIRQFRMPKASTGASHRKGACLGRLRVGG